MRWAHFTNGALQSEGVLPPDLRDASADERTAAGYYEIVDDPPKPPDTGTTTHDRSFDVETGAIVWIERDKTADELAAEQRASAEQQIRQQVADHLAGLRKITESSGSLSNAQLSNAVRVLARGQIQLIRLAVGLLDGTD